MRIVCIGGGAASFFFAANLAERRPDWEITIYEQSKDVLGKVRISGGGRCNVTHACFDPEELVRFYPRGERELLGPFNIFNCSHTVGWFQAKGVKLKTENDGRMFPVSDDSISIVNALMGSCAKAGVKVETRKKIKNISSLKEASKKFRIEFIDSTPIDCDFVFVGAGSSKQMWQVLEHLGLEIESPVPSLFTFQVRDERIKNMAGISMSGVAISASINGKKFKTKGPMLITHKGLSGPAVLKLSARAARVFFEVDYRCEIAIDFRPDLPEKMIRSWRESEGKKIIANATLFGFPKRLWTSLIAAANLDPQKKLASISKKDMNKLIEIVKKSSFEVLGQNRFKEEFVTAGGVQLSEIDFSTYSSKKIPGMYFGGEVLNIDALTGGFNFQAAWTSAFIAAVACAKNS